MKKSKITLIILILLLLGGGIGTYFYFFNQTSEENSELSENSSPFPNQSGNIDSTQTRGGGSFSNETETGVFVETLSIPQLRKIAVGPVSGALILPQEGVLSVRYIEKETGHIFDTYATSSQIIRITNTTIPRIQNAQFTPEGERIVLQYLSEDKETIETFLADIKKEADEEGEGSLEGEFLPKNIKGFAINDSGSSLFYLLEAKSGSEGMRLNLKDNKTSRIFEHPLTEWEIDYISNNTLAFTTKPSGLFSGFLYFVNNSGDLFPILRDIKGLSVKVSPDEKSVLYSESTNNTFLLKLFDVETQKSEELTLRTLAEKCVWSSERPHIIYCAIPNEITPGVYPDIWYQGRVSFSDSLWEIDTETQVTKLLADPIETAGESVDIINLSFSPEEVFFIFINKKDSSLWGLLLPQESNAREEATEPLSE